MLPVYDVLMFVDIVDMVTGQKQSSSGGMSSSSKKPLFFLIRMRAQTKEIATCLCKQFCTEILITLRPTIMEAESNMLGTLDLSPRLKSVTETATCLVLGRVSIMLSTWNCRRRPRFSTIIGFIVDDYDLILSLII